MTNLSDKKKLEIANICYANVASGFADFINPINRGINFKWDSFAKFCERDSINWMGIHNVKGDKEQINNMAKQYALEIATNLVNRAGLI